MKIGIVTFTDGRARIAKATEKECRIFQERLVAHFKRKRHNVVAAKRIVWNYDTARREARRIALAYPDVVVFNYCVWSFPGLTAQVANLIPEVPVLLVGDGRAAHPGLAAFFAAAGTLAEIGRPIGRVLGDIRKADVQAQVTRFLHLHDPDERARGERAAALLYGQRYGEFDGPSMGLYTGHVDPSQWMEQFGVHVFHRGQLHLWQMAQKIRADRVEAGLAWLGKHCARIHWDRKRLTPGPGGTLARQIRMYLATKDLCRQEGIDFCGLSGQLDMTEWPDLCVTDVPEALLNEMADWEQPEKAPLICASACDANGALTMQLMHHLTGTPVLCTALRHYHEKHQLYDLANSGAHAPWYARRSKDFRRNWKECHIRPAPELYARAGGGSVQSYAAPADKVTFGRIARRHGRFMMLIFTGAFARVPRARQERLARQTAAGWPHAFARFDIPLSALREHCCSSHLHAIVGDHVTALAAACDLLGIEPIVLD